MSITRFSTRSLQATTAVLLGVLVSVSTTMSAGVAFSQPQGSGAAKSAHFEKARGFGQCEIFLLKGQPGKYEGEVYNTSPLNDCPPAKFDPIDGKQVAKTSGWDVAWKNPRRFWMMDHLTISLVGEPRAFDGLMFNFVAKMAMPPSFTLDGGQQSFSYKPTKIQRVTDYTFLKGKPVFLLQSPEGSTWVMQTYTTHTDASLTEADLPNLGKKLTLPTGWHFKSKTLDRDLVIHTNGIANIVPDNLENMYQGCLDNVCSFDPWK